MLPPTSTARMPRNHETTKDGFASEPSESQPQRTREFPHGVRLNGQPELRTADDGVDASERDTVQEIRRVDSPVERKALRPEERPSCAAVQRECRRTADRVA